MIASIKGNVILIKDRFLVIETKEGVGYKVFITEDVLKTIKTDDYLSLFIYSHIREDAFDLYGFIDYEELEFFELLISVSGIGPKGALGILNIANSQSLKQAIKKEDLTYLNKISGIGRKTAEKIILELRDKIVIHIEKDNQNDLDVLEALKALGYSQYEVRNILKEIDNSLDTNAKIKEALKILSKK